MSFGKILRRMFGLFPYIFTATIIAALVFMLLFDRGQLFLLDIISLFIISILGTFSLLIFYSKRELSLRSKITRYTIHWIVVLGVAFGLSELAGWAVFACWARIVVFVVIATVIYVVAVRIEFKNEQRLIDRLNEKLREKYPE